MLELKKLKVEAYNNYYADLSSDMGDLNLDWNEGEPFFKIWNNNTANTTNCHVDNLDNLIEGLRLLREKIKK